eukprot:2741240-Amphidinium_carterae.2
MKVGSLMPHHAGFSRDAANTAGAPRPCLTLRKFEGDVGRVPVTWGVASMHIVDTRETAS